MLLGLAAIGSIFIAANLVFPPGSAPADRSIGPRVRGVTPAVNALIARGVERSHTFARLVREIDETDVVVYVETRLDLPLGLDGRLTFITAAGGVRYLRVQVPGNVGPEQLIGILGHELQHALEIAAHPAVQDSDGVAGLYRRIGIQSTRDHYDTTEARIIGRRVRSEMSSEMN